MGAVKEKLYREVRAVFPAVSFATSKSASPQLLKGDSVQIQYPFVGSVRQFNEIADPGRYRPDHCRQCEAHRPLSAHGFYRRTLVE